MKYKLIASDFDGTIYDGERVSERMLQAIADYEKAGGKFVLVTGRIFSSIKRWLPILKCEKQIIACQGSCVYDGETGEVLKRFSIDTELVSKVTKYLEEKGEVCHCYTDEEFFVEKPNPRTTQYAEYCKVAPHYSGEPISTFVHKFDGLNKIMGIVGFSDMKERIEGVRAIVGDMAEVSQSSPVFLEVVAAAAGKGNALKWLAEYLGIKQEEIVAVGDQLNDVSMIKYAGLGVAVDNAIQEVKDSASYVTASVSEDGVADLIYKVINNEI